MVFLCRFTVVCRVEPEKAEDSNIDMKTMIPLSDGQTHYEVRGPSDGPTVVLVHGISIPSPIWESTVDALVKAGLQVMRYDLYGRGFSESLSTAYDLQLFIRQLTELLDALELVEPIHLIGLSLGGLIATAFTAQYPTRVQRLALIDPTGIGVPVPAGARLVQIWPIGEIIFGLLGDRLLLSQSRKGLYRTEFLSAYLDMVRPHLKKPGFKRAFLSTVRHTALLDHTELFQTVGRGHHPVLLLWGRRDEIIPFEINEKVREAIPQAEFHVIEEAGHVPHYEQPEVVNSILLDFLGKKSLR